MKVFWRVMKMNGLKLTTINFHPITILKKRLEVILDALNK